MISRLTLGDIPVDVVFKDIRNVHLSVHPPTGRVRISAPSRMSPEALRAFAIAKLPWIRKQQEKMQQQEREAPREFLDRESHYVWGVRYLLEVTERDRAPALELKGRRMILTVRPGTDVVAREAIVARWYRDQIRSALPELLASWEPILGVRVARVFVQRMKTKWGSCNSSARTIRLNTELAKKPKECLEYVVVHETAHLLEPRHSERFVALMDQFLPRWQLLRERLNRLPVRHADWEY